MLCWLGTVDESGAPNVSPKEVFCAWGEDSILIANIASPESERNIRQCPRVCVSFVEVLVQKGFKVKGFATVIDPANPQYSELIKPLVKITGGNFPVHNIFKVSISHVFPIIAPSYRMQPERAEEQQIMSALRTYGVQRE